MACFLRWTRLFVKENLARSTPFRFPGRRSIVACLDGGSLSAGVGCVMLEHSFDWSCMMLTSLFF